MNEQPTLYERMAARIANLAQPERILFLPPEENWIGSEPLFIVIMDRLRRGRTRQDIAAAIYRDLHASGVYPDEDLGVLVRTSKDMEQAFLQTDTFMDTLKNKAQALYERVLDGRRS